MTKHIRFPFGFGKFSDHGWDIFDWHGWSPHGRHHAHGRHHHRDNDCPPDQTPDPVVAVDHTSNLIDLETRQADGTGNNQTNSDWGSTGTQFIRLAPADYADGIGNPRDGANPREISNTILAQETDQPNTFGVSDLFTYFGQFIDHDIDLTNANSNEQFSTPVPPGDPEFFLQTEFSLDRSNVADGTGVTSPREHINSITAFVDASNVYGSSEEVTDLLRTDGGTGAYLLVGADGYAPTLGQIRAERPDATITDAELLAGNATDDFYVGGDVRINENIALTSMHSIWIKEHNHQVDNLKAKHPDWTDQQLFDAARVMVEAEYQNIVFNEYLPLLVGAGNIPDYQGYDPSVNPGIAHEFATAAYRLGHSQISPTLHRTDEDGAESAEGHIGLFQAFFTPSELVDGGGVDPLFRGLMEGLGQEIDENIVNDVRNLLFGPPGVGSDLGVLNIMRGREHGIPPLNDVREALGLDRLTDFSDLTSNPELAAQFAAVYDSIDDVDLWPGGLAEGRVSGSQLGETFHGIVLDQFVRLRDGDQFYFEERLKDAPELLEQVLNTDFSDIISRTTDIGHVQDDAFVAHNRIGGTWDGDKMKGTDDPDLMMGFEGHDVLKGRRGDDDLYGDNGNDKLKGGRGEDVINGGSGNDKMWGGKDADIFVFEKNSGMDKVYDFKVAQDKIDLSSLGYSSFDDVIDAASQKGRNTIIEFDPDTHDQVKLVGVKLKHLEEDNFILSDDEA